jgi:hypothetical protein
MVAILLGGRPSDHEEEPMIRMLEGLPDNVLGVEATGRVTDAD